MSEPEPVKWMVDSCPHEKCGGVYAILRACFERYRLNGGSWRCPYCGCEIVASKPVIPGLEFALARQREDAKLARESETRLRRKLAAERAAKTRFRKQLAACREARA